MDGRDIPAAGLPELRSAAFKRIGLTVEALGRLRNAADDPLRTSGPFVSPRIAATVLTDAERAIALLDAIEADPARRARAARTIPP